MFRSGFPICVAILTMLHSGNALIGAIVDDHFDQNSRSLTSRISPLLTSHEGTASAMIRIYDQDDKLLAESKHESERPMPTASLIKVAVMVEAYCQAAKGEVDLDQKIELTEDAKVPGSGILTEHFSAGTQFSIRDLIRLMMRYSDNTATNLVIDSVGIKAINAQMRGLGYPTTQIFAKVFRRDTSVDLEKSKQFGLGSTSAGEILQLLNAIRSQRLARAEDCDEMLEHLESCDDDLKLPRLLPG
ncbi:MAG: serine hydrolase, partial [Planctomycetota bacterium]